jgi:hypothetical protein
VGGYASGRKAFFKKLSAHLFCLAYARRLALWASLFVSLRAKRTIDDRPYGFALIQHYALPAEYGVAVLSALCIF